MTPTESKFCEIGTTPRRETIPTEGLNAQAPQASAGIMRLPRVSVPSAASQKPDATATADPELEPAQRSLARVIYDLYDVIKDRQLNPVEGSYTNYLFAKGQDKILKKVGEEAAETIIASKNESRKEVIYEMGDLWYHCLVLLAYHGIKPEELFTELMSRRKGGEYHKFTGKTGIRPDM